MMDSPFGEGKMALKAGLKGRVMIDEEGNALIEFEGLENKQWIFSMDFQRVEAVIVPHGCSMDGVGQTKPMYFHIYTPRRMRFPLFLLPSIIRDHLPERMEDPWFQTVAVSSAGGAIVLGGVGGSIGTAVGVLVGTMLGAPLVLFTFGLSLPVGAIAGGSVGLGTGMTVGGGARALCGAAAGHGFYSSNVDIQSELQKGKMAVLHAKSVEKARGVASGIKDLAENVTRSARK